MQTSSFPPPLAPVSAFPPSALFLAVFSTPSEPFFSPTVWIQSLPLVAPGP